MKDMMIGIDLAKDVFPVHGALRTGEVQFRKKLTRTPFPVFMAKQEPNLVIFEACGSAHYWACEMEVLGHEVKLIAPQYARPFVKRQKNDAADAETIVIAARQPEMRFVEPKTIAQQSRAAIDPRGMLGPAGVDCRENGAYYRSNCETQDAGC